MKTLLAFLAIVFSNLSFGQTMCPNGQFVSSGPCTMCADGTYVGGGQRCVIAPDGSFVGGGRSGNEAPRMAPNGSFVGGGGSKTTMCPDGTFVSGSRCMMAPDGKFVGQ